MQTRASIVIVLATLLAVAAGFLSCQQAPGPKPALSGGGAGVDATDEDPRPRIERIGDTIIYHVQHGNAEEIAENVLRPLLEREYGNHVVIVPRKESNLILIRFLTNPPERFPSQPPRPQPR